MSNYTIVFKDSGNYNEMLHDTTGQVVFSYNTNELRIVWYSVHHNLITIDGHIFVFNQLFEQIKKWINRDIGKYFNSAFAPHFPHTEPRVVLSIKQPYLNDPTVKLLSRFINFKFTIRPKLTLFLPQQQQQHTTFAGDGGDGGPPPPPLPPPPLLPDGENCNRDYQFPQLERNPYEIEPVVLRQIPSAPPLLDATFTVANINDYTDEGAALAAAADDTDDEKPKLKRTYNAIDDDDDDDDDSFDGESVSTRSSDEESILDIDEIQSEVASTLRSSFIGNVKRLKIYNENITAPLRTITERIIEHFTVPNNAHVIVQTAFTTLQNDMVLNLDTAGGDNIPSPQQTPNAFKSYLYDKMNNALRVGDEQSIAAFIRVLHRVLPMFIVDDFHVPFNAVNLL